MSNNDPNFNVNDEFGTSIRVCADPTDPTCQTRVILRQPAVILNQSEIPIQEVAESAILATTASYARVAQSLIDDFDYEKLENVFYVTQEGDDTRDGKSIVTAFRTIKRAAQAVAEYTASVPAFPPPRSTIRVSPGYYIETASITLPAFTSIVGNDLRTTVVRPTPETRTQNLFLVNNACYAYGLRLEGCEINDLNDPRTGFFFAFAPGAYIVTSPYIQNCTAAHTPPDKFYVPLNYSGSPQPNPEVGNGPGGMIVDDSVLDGYSPLKSMIVDAYTQVAFNGMGLVVRGEGYAQQVSFFTNFSHVGNWAIDGGHASLLNSNTTFGDYGLRATGKRILVKPNTGSVSPYINSTDSDIVQANKNLILNYMMQKLQISGSYSGSYIDSGSFIYTSTMKDAGFLVDALVSDLKDDIPGRTSQFTQALFKGQDVSSGSIYTLPTASGFDKGAIAVFRVNDGLLLANDFIKSWEYMKEYATTLSGLTPSGSIKIGQLIDIPIDTITSVVINVEPTLLEVFGSLITSTSHDFSYAGSGVNFLGLPANQRGIGRTNFNIRVAQSNGGRVFYTAGDESGDFFAGRDFIIKQETGTIEGRTFNKALLARVTPLQLALETI